jgi:hypothetical protein
MRHRVRPRGAYCLSRRPMHKPVRRWSFAVRGSTSPANGPDRTASSPRLRTRCTCSADWLGTGGHELVPERVARWHNTCAALGAHRARARHRSASSPRRATPIDSESSCARPAYQSHRSTSAQCVSRARYSPGEPIVNDYRSDATAVMATLDGRPRPVESDVLRTTVVALARLTSPRTRTNPQDDLSL